MLKMIKEPEEIKKVILEKGGRPRVIGYNREHRGVGIDFPGRGDDGLLRYDMTRDVSWEEFFEVFERDGLLFFYDDEEQDPTMSYRFERAELLDAG